MVAPPDASMVAAEQPHPSVVKVAALIDRAAAQRELRLVDIEVLADSVRRAWPEVQLPRRPAAEGKIGWLEMDPRRCGDKTCACARDPTKRHPRVVFRWRVGKKKRKKVLRGKLGSVEAPPDLAKPLRDEIERINKAAQLDMGFLHDD